MTTTVPSPLKGFVLGVHPTSRGFGWVLFESPLSPVDWGLVHGSPRSNTRLLTRFERLLERYEPSTLVLEEFEGVAPRRTERIQALCRALLHYAASRGVDTPIYSREAIQQVFAKVGASTRGEIAAAVAQYVDAFRNRTPRARTAWRSEDARQSLFDAAALVLTYFAYQGELD